jgi:hypothetical protein
MAGRTDFGDSIWSPGAYVLDTLLTSDGEEKNTSTIICSTIFWATVLWSTFNFAFNNFAAKDADLMWQDTQRSRTYVIDDCAHVRHKIAHTSPKKRSSAQYQKLLTEQQNLDRQYQEITQKMNAYAAHVKQLKDRAVNPIWPLTELCE